MKVFYDSHTDTLSMILKDNVAVHESDEDKPGVILDYDKEGNLISRARVMKSGHYTTRAPTR